MSSRQGKCPGCGLSNFRDALECQWCALALSGRARNEYIDDAPPGPGRPWGLLLMLFAFLVVGGGLARHVQQRPVGRAELAAEAAEAEAVEMESTGPPALSGRGPSDPPRADFSSVSEMIEKNRRERGEFPRRNPYQEYHFGPRPMMQEETPHNTQAQRAGGRRLEAHQRGLYQQPVSDSPEERDDQ